MKTDVPKINFEKSDFRLYFLKLRKISACNQTFLPSEIDENPVRFCHSYFRIRPILKRSSAISSAFRTKIKQNGQNWST